MAATNARSGLITVATAGTAQQGPDTGPGSFLLKYVYGNTGDTVYVGNDGAGDVASTNGYPLMNGECAVFTVNNLNELWFDVKTNGDKIAWARVDRANT